MSFDAVSLIYFSPTGTTRTVLESIAEGMGAASIQDVDLTLPQDAGTTDITTSAAIIGVPVYAGRVPATAVERLKAMKAEGVPAVLVAVYGNRAFEDALLELSDLTKAQGFRPVAGAAFIGEHSFSTADKPIAVGRPDDADRTKAAEFGQAVANGFADGSLLKEGFVPELPGNRPHRDGVNRPPMSPITDPEACEECGSCEEVCPTGAILSPQETDKEKCIMCAACVKICPNGARTIVAEQILNAADWLVANCSDRKEPEFFLPA